MYIYKELTLQEQIKRLRKSEKLNLEIEEIKKQLEPLNSKLKELCTKLQEVCLHQRVEVSGGGKWFDWPEWGYISYNYHCLDCGCYGSSDCRTDEEQEKYLKLRHGKIVKDTSTNE